MERPRVNATVCKYKENKRRLKEQFINCINDEVIKGEIVKELTSVKDTVEIKIELVDTAEMKSPYIGQNGGGPKITFSFKHCLVPETA